MPEGWPRNGVWSSRPCATVEGSGERQPKRGGQPRTVTPEEMDESSESIDRKGVLNLKAVFQSVDGGFDEGERSKSGEKTSLTNTDWLLKPNCDRRAQRTPGTGSASCSAVTAGE